MGSLDLQVWLSGPGVRKTPPGLSWFVSKSGNPTRAGVDFNLTQTGFPQSKEDAPTFFLGLVALGSDSIASASEVSMRQSPAFSLQLRRLSNPIASLECSCFFSIHNPSKQPIYRLSGFVSNRRSPNRWRPFGFPLRHPKQRIPSQKARRSHRIAWLLTFRHTSWELGAAKDPLPPING